MARIVYNKIIPFKGFRSTALWPFVFVRSDVPVDEPTVNHEQIHCEQQKEMLLVFFYLWYAIEWVVRLIQYRTAHTAYRNISFEREAYAKEYDLAYVSMRKRYAWIHYL